MDFRSSEEAFAELNRCLDWLASEDVVELPAETMGDDLKALECLINRVQAESIRRLKRFDAGRGYTSSNSFSAASWLRWQCKLTGAAALNRVGVARRIDGLPQTREAFAQGAISFRHAALIATTSEQCGAEWGGKAEAILVEAATTRGDPACVCATTWNRRVCSGKPKTFTSSATCT